jgi:hypothetical protein
MEREGGSETYEVIYNSVYGGFSFPDKFVHKVFERYPPDSTELGKSLFRPERCGIFVEQDGVPPLGADGQPPNFYYEVVKKEPFVNGYMRCFTTRYSRQNNGTYKASSCVFDKSSNYVTKDNIKYYFISGFVQWEYTWRESPEVIAMAKEHGLFRKGSALAIDTVPVGYDYNINEYDGLETVVPLFPYRKVIGELIECIKTGKQDGLGVMSKKLVSGEMDIKRI